MRKPPKQEAKIDRLGRRINLVRSPQGISVHLSDADLNALAWQHRHGDLPTPYIQRYKHLMGYSSSPETRHTSRRYCRLFHENKTPHGGAYIDWPHQQHQDVYRPNSKHRVHRPSKYALKAIEEAGLLRQNTPKSSSSWWHDFLRSCFTASIELRCMEEPEKYTFLHHDTVINNAIAKTSETPEFRVGNDTFTPDVMFGIRYNEEKKVRLFAVEIDMMTESITSKKSKTTILEKMRRYQQYIKSGQYKQDFAFGGSFMNIYLTINYRHACNMLKEAPEEPFILFNWIPDFVYPRKPPDLMPWLFDEPYDRAGYEPIYISKA